MILPPKEVPVGVDFIAFTDGSVRVPKPWQSRAYEFPSELPPRLQGRYLKLHGPQLLPEYDLSIWADGNVRSRWGLRSLIDNFVDSDKSMALIKHPARSSILDEAAECRRLQKISAADEPRLKAQIDRYQAEGMPDNTLVESNVIFRRHAAYHMRDAMTHWWSEVETNCIRDQISLPYILWKYHIDVHYWNWNTRDAEAPFFAYGHRTDLIGDLGTYFAARKDEALLFRLGAPPLHLARRALRKAQYVAAKHRK